MTKSIKSQSENPMKQQLKLVLMFRVMSNSRNTNMIDATKCSSFTKLIRVAAYVIRFETNLKANKSGNLTILGELTQNELQNSETIWLKSA